MLFVFILVSSFLNHHTDLKLRSRHLTGSDLQGQEAKLLLVTLKQFIYSLLNGLLSS